MKWRWNWTMLNLCCIVVAILKMATGRNLSMMSRIDCRHWKISTGRHFQNGHHNTSKLQHCPISSKFDIWVDNDVLNVTYHYVKFYVSIIIHVEVININVRNFNFPIGFYSNPHPLWTPQNMTLTCTFTKRRRACIL
jgi:hypothetical protein